MESKIQQLTDLIYNEGVVKGQKEAEQIIESAKEEAAKIVADATKQSQEILAKANQETQELKEHTQKELVMYSAQALNALKSEIASILSDSVVTDAVKKFTKDQDAFNQFVLSVAQEWAKQGELVISAENAESIKGYFMAKAKELLDKGVEIKQVNGFKGGFSVAPADGSYRVDFGQEQLEAYFKSFVRPALAEALFPAK